MLVGDSPSGKYFPRCESSRPPQNLFNNQRKAEKMINECECGNMYSDTAARVCPCCREMLCHKCFPEGEMICNICRGDNNPKIDPSTKRNETLQVFKPEDFDKTFLTLGACLVLALGAALTLILWAALRAAF